MYQKLEFTLVCFGNGYDNVANAEILPGVTLGDFCQVETGSVFIKPFPNHSIVTGVPAASQRKFK